MSGLHGKPPDYKPHGQRDHQFTNALAVHKVGSESWVIDSSASDHMTGNASLLKDFIPCTHNYSVKIADGSHCKDHMKGNLEFFRPK